MIRESLYFSFDNRKSSDFGIYNVSVSDGLFEESITSAKTINESYPSGAFKPYFFGVQKEVKQFPLRFSFLEKWNDELIDETVRWLNVDDYKPLFFEADIDRVFYAMPIDDIKQIHNGLKEGYLTLNVRCDSAYSYGHMQITPEYEVKDEPRIIEIPNRGHYPYYPEIWIEKTSVKGDIAINNLSNGNDEFKFTDIEVGEKLYIDCMNEDIVTNKENTYRYDNFNDNYLEIIYGKNQLKISENVKIKFQYQYIFS